MKMKEDLILELIQIQLQFKFLHWQTTGDAKHRAYGDIYDKFNDLIDTFAETLMGKYGRFEFEGEFNLSFKDIRNVSLQEFMDFITEFLVSFSESLDEKYDTDLLNIRDEMLQNINKLKYLLTLES